jgi:pyruvate kinase
MGNRRAKIVATVGPKCNDDHTLRAMIEAGVDVFRLNFAHAPAEEHKRMAESARAQADACGRVVGILVDLPGPKMRTGSINGGEVELVASRELVLSSEEVDGDEAKVSTSVEGLARLVEEGDEVYLADGEIVLRVESVKDDDVITSVVRGGVLRSRKGMHLPGAEQNVEAFTKEDRQALKESLSLGADMVGLSFVKDAEDIRRAKQALPDNGPRPMIVAKIETASAVDNLDEIVPEADAVMVARGDLGIQTPLRRVPVVQKDIIRSCNEWGRPVITATQMLESMTDSPLPTRAEVTDVANAVIDGTDALMLSEETAVGRDPVAAVKTMAEIAETAESCDTRQRVTATKGGTADRVSWAVARAAVRAAEELEVAAILCPTRSGSTPRRVASSRPAMPVVAFSSDRAILGPLGLVWGVVPVHLTDTPTAYDQRESLQRVIATALEAHLVETGDLVAIVAGGSGRRAGSTDFVRIMVA